MVPSTGLYSDVPSADNPHETESIEVTTILTITMLLVSNNELPSHALERKKIPEPSFGKAPIFCARAFFVLYEFVGRVRTTFL
jgi:hypothetical protein